MKAVILAAGRSSRLYPLTLEKPKCLLELEENFSIIDHQIEIIKNCGIEDITVVVGYKKDLIIDYLKNKDISFKSFDNYEKFNNIHTLYSIKDILDDDTIIFFSDVLIGLSLLRKIVNSKDDFSLLVHNREVLEDTMRVMITNGSIHKIGSHIMVEDGTGNFIGIAKYTKKALNLLLNEIDTLVGKKEHDQDYYIYPLNKLSKEFKIGYEYAEDEPWIEMDFLEDYEKAKELIYPIIKAQK